MNAERHIRNLQRKLKNLKEDKQSAEKVRDIKFENAQRVVEDIDVKIRKVTANLQLYDRID